MLADENHLEMQIAIKIVIVIVSEDTEEVHAFTFALVWFAFWTVLNGEKPVLCFPRLTQAWSERGNHLASSLLSCAWTNDCVRNAVR